MRTINQKWWLTVANIISADWITRRIGTWANKNKNGNKNTHSNKNKTQRRAEQSRGESHEKRGALLHFWQLEHSYNIGDASIRNGRQFDAVRRYFRRPFPFFFLFFFYFFFRMGSASIAIVPLLLNRKSCWRIFCWIIYRWFFRFEKKLWSRFCWLIYDLIIDYSSFYYYHDLIYLIINCLIAD